MLSTHLEMNMNLAARCIALALSLATTAGPALAASDYFWNCTTPEGIKYADATQCDKGDTAVKVIKGSPAAPAPAPMVQLAQQAEPQPEALNTGGVCPSNPSDCGRPNYGVAEGSARTHAIALFMRKKQCEFLKRFPERCAKPH